MALLSMFRGDDESFDVAVVDRNDAPVDLTDLSLRFTVKRDLHDSDDDAVISKTTGDGIVVVGDPEDGIARIDVAAAETDDLEPCRLRWDLQARDSDDVTRTLATGTLDIRGDVSRTSP